MLNTPFLQPELQKDVALQVGRKVELSSTFRNVARQVTNQRHEPLNRGRFQNVIELLAGVLQDANKNCECVTPSATCKFSVASLQVAMNT